MGVDFNITSYLKHEKQLLYCRYNFSLDLREIRATINSRFGLDE